MGYSLHPLVIWALAAAGVAGAEPWSAREAAVVAAHAGSVKLEKIGESRNGAAINAIWLAHPGDTARDRRIDEDGPMDMNGDGVITQMRIKNPRAGLVPGLVATEIAEADDPRLLRRADAGKGERPEWAVITEGQDRDGDGLIAEDGP